MDKAFVATSARKPAPAVREDLLAAIDRGVANYFAECRAQVPAFVRRHFRYPGAWHTNRHALGWDLLRAPLNLIWAPVYLSARLLAWLLDRAGFARAARLLRLCPAGMRTRLQQYLIDATQSQLLQRTADERRSRLRECIVGAIVEAENCRGLSAEQEARLEQNLRDALAQYALTRTASADISNTLIATVAGAFTLQKFTPGGIAIGFSLAGVLANRLAAWNFFLGPALGQWYYALFPAEPGVGLLLFSTGAVMAVFAVLACFSGLVSDPVQAWLGIHQRRLNRMLDSLERDLRRQGSGSFRPKDVYLARLMDILDAARIGVA